MYACIYRPPAPDRESNRRERGTRRDNFVHASASSASSAVALSVIAQEFSPRYESHGDDLMAIDVSGLRRMFGDARAIGDAIRRELAARGAGAHVAVAGTRTAALITALAQPGLTVIASGAEAEALAPLPMTVLGKSEVSRLKAEDKSAGLPTSDFPLETFKKWGLCTLGELASLPAADLVSRLGRSALTWQAMARGEDLGPLVPTLPEERFDASLELEWPIEGLEPLSFVLTRLLEPLSTRLERRDRGVAVLHVLLRLVTRETVARRLELPTPMREVRALRTLALLDLEAHPPGGAIDRVTIVIDPTPGRVLQRTLFTRAHPTPEQLSTLLARLGALMGQDRLGAPAAVDSHRPGAFAMQPFKTEHRQSAVGSRQSAISVASHQPPATSHQPLASALRRCRQPVPARVAVVDGRPVRVTTDRRGFAGGQVLQCAGPWKTSGVWWMDGAGRAGETGRSGEEDRVLSHQPPATSHQLSWDRDEWDVALADGAVYRIFQDRAANGWFIDAMAD
jgi:protein ImuB